MFWFIVIAVIVFVGFKFFSSLQKDNDDLQNRTLFDKFQTIVDIINASAFEGRGRITMLDKREFNLYEENSNQIIKFQYSTGILTIIWKYKYFQKEAVLERRIDNARNFSIFEQQRIGDSVVKEMAKVIAKHKIDVMGPVLDAPNKNDYTITVFRTGLENSLRAMIHKCLENSRDMPEMMHGLMVMQTAGTFRETFTESYSTIKNEVEEDGTTSFLSKAEYNKLIDSVTSKVLGEFIEMPKNREHNEDYHDDPY